MSDPVLHIKDSYYFEVPKALCPSNFESRTQFQPMWGRNDPSYQNWEFEQTYHALDTIPGLSGVPAEEKLHHDWLHWRDHDDHHANFAKPFWRYLDENHAANVAGYETWKAAEVTKTKAATDAKPADIQKATELKLSDYLEAGHVAKPDVAWFSKGMTNPLGRDAWLKQVKTIQKSYWDQYIGDSKQPEWSKDTLHAYNEHLSGKILIPQFFGTQRNLYEPESGFSLSKFMIIEMLVALALILVFGWIGGRARPGGSPRGLFWNMLEVFLVFIRDQIARPAIGGHHDEAGHENDRIEAESSGYATATHAKELDPHAPNGAHAEQVEHHKHAVGHHPHHNPFELADSFVPMLWTIFLFILGCNLCGMIPWVGTPTGAWSVTLGLAIVTFVTVCIAGISQFGVIGFLANQVPSMDVPFPMNLIIKPMIFAIELFGLLIKHMVLSIRLLANMVAGHLVLLGIMGIAFSAGSAEFFTRPDTPSWIYPVAATASVLASTALSLLELGVAFLQAYVFTLLSALFIGAAVHKH